MKVDFSFFGFSLFGAFVIFMISLVFLASVQKVELVTENYYEKELDFQELKIKMDRAQRFKKSIQLETAKKELILKFFDAGEIESQEIYGYVFFYKPDSKAFDQMLNFETDNGIYKINTYKFAEGYYQVKVEWVSQGNSLSQGYAVQVDYNYRNKTL